MKKTKVMTLMATTTLGALALVPMSALAVDGGEYQTNGAIQFAQIRTQRIQLIRRIQIRINQLRQLIQLIRQDLSQGQQVRYPLTMHLVYLLGNKRLPQKYDLLCRNTKYKDNAGADQEGPNFVQVSDNRGTETGWTLKVKQNGQFKTEANQELTAAKVTLSNGRVVSASQSAKPTTAPATIELNPTGAESVVMVAAIKKVRVRT